jgi:hypothetical protein
LSFGHKVVAVSVVQLVIALNALCLCPQSAFASEDTPPAPTQSHCGHGGEAPTAPTSSDHRPDCPHCGHHVSLPPAAELGATVGVTSAALLGTVASIGVPSVDVRPGLLIGSTRSASIPPSALQRKVVLLI